MLGALIVISSFTIEGFLSGPNIKAILLFAAFLGIACIGQTLVALMGGLDLSIPFVIGASNIGLLFLISLGVPSFVAAGFVLILGGVIGFNDCGFRSIHKFLKFFRSHRHYQELSSGLTADFRGANSAITVLRRLEGRSNQDRYFRKLDAWEPEHNFFRRF